MHSTPTKAADTSLTQSLTPVRFLDSPKAQSHSPNSDSNANACRTRLDAIVKTLQDNFSKWQLAQTRGLALCHAIEAIKTRCIEAVANKPGEEGSLYPKELVPLCQKLAVIASVCVDIARNARESLRQLRALSKLPGTSEEVFYRSWQLAEFLSCVEELSGCYEREAEVKNQVMQDLAHCATRAALVRCTSAWEYPQHVDDWVRMVFAFLAEEISVNKK